MSEIDAVRDWLESNLGRVRRIDRQPRWRPVWFADVERDGAVLELCVRGDRTDFPGIFPLEHEMLCQRLLHEHGIPVAAVHGWIDEPRAFVIDRIGGQPDFQGVDDAERDAVVDDYLAVLARLHALDVEPFARAGVVRAPAPARSGEVGFEAYLSWYRRSKKRPDPFLEFCLKWLERHPLAPHERESMIVWDSGQFHHAGARILAVLDLELAHIGDPMMDLAAWRMRDTIVGFGDFNQLYTRYEQLSGVPVDVVAVRHHHVVFTLSNRLAFHSALADPPPGSDYMTNLQWCGETDLFAVEAIAEEVGIELEPVELPAPEPSPVANAHAHLVASLWDLPVADEAGAYERRRAFRLARHLQRFDEIGRACVAADLDELAPILGRRPATSRDGDAALEQFVLGDGGTHDDDLIRLFHRRLWRAHQLLGPAGSAMTRHLPIQRFG